MIIIYMTRELFFCTFVFCQWPFTDESSLFSFINVIVENKMTMITLFFFLWLLLSFSSFFSAMFDGFYVMYSANLFTWFFGKWLVASWQSLLFVGRFIVCWCIFFFVLFPSTLLLPSFSVRYYLLFFVLKTKHILWESFLWLRMNAKK